MTVMQLFALFVSLIPLFGIAIQLHIALKRLKADHERQRKQSTIEKFSEIYRNCRYEMESRFGTDPVHANGPISPSPDDQEFIAAVNRLLSTLEHLAVGVNSSVYDRNVLFRMSAGSIISMKNRLQAYIHHRRTSLGQPTLFIEFEHLATEFERQYKIKPVSRGNIKHS